MDGGGIVFFPLKDLYILHTLFAVKHLTTWKREREWNVHTIKIEKHRWIQIDMNCDFIKWNKCTELLLLLLLLPSFHTHFTFIVRQNNAMKNRLFVFLFHASFLKLFFYRILIKSLWYSFVPSLFRLDFILWYLNGKLGFINCYLGGRRDEFDGKEI